jgi:hypothetical protein
MFLANRFAGRTAQDLFDMLLLRLEHLQNSSLQIRDPEEFKYLSYIQPWALESIDSLSEFERAVRLIDANTYVHPRDFISLDYCRTFMTRHQAPLVAVAGIVMSSTLCRSLAVFL